MKIIDINEYKREKTGEIKMNNTLPIDNNCLNYDNEVSIDDVSNYFLNKEPMSNKKLQKICYYAYSWYLNIYKKELFENKFEAWRHGPVYPSLYKKYKSYEYKDINIHNNIKIPCEVEVFLDRIYECYGTLTAGEIEQLSHIEEPWKKTRSGLFNFESSRRPIKKELIENYYIKEYGDIIKNNIDFEDIVNKSWEI